MEKINVEIFLNEYKKIENLLSEISNIPKSWGDGECFEGLSFEDDGITYKTSTSYPGCGTDEFSFFVKFEELNNPIEYFKDKYQKEIDDEAERLKNLKKIAENAVKTAEIKRLKELMEKNKEDIL